jgi:ATP-binding cassette, subfamily B, bacterial
MDEEAKKAKKVKKIRKDKKDKNNEMSVTGSMHYTLKMIWGADKGCVIYSFFKNCTEEVFNSFFFVYFTQLIYTFIEKKIDYGRLAKIILIFCLLHIIIHFSSAGYAFYIRLKRPVVYRHIFHKVIKKSSQIELSRYEQPDFYDKFSKVFDECLTKAMDGLFNLSLSCGTLLSSICALGIIAKVDPWLILFVAPPVIASLFFGSKENKEYYSLRNDETRTKRVMEYAKRIFYEKKYASEIRLYGIRNVLFKKHRDNYTERYQVHVRHRKKIAYYQFMEYVVFLGLTFFSSYIYVSYTIKVNGSSRLAAYIAMLSAVGYISYQIKNCVTTMIEAGTNCIYMNNLKEFLNYESLQGIPGTKKVEVGLGDIVFDHVTFTYVGAKRPVINDLSLTIRRGERIALVGENGAGKTTLIKLLMGLYPVTQGKLTVGGADVNIYDPQEYHKHFGTVFQDLQIFALPLSENVLMRKPKTEEERQLVIDSLVKAQFGDKLPDLVKGIDTMITKEFDDEGYVCSGGQAQKIAIARVFAKNPDVVILDEPSSALDPIAEYNMYNNMLQVSEGKTVFFISHRLSAARIADKIYFLENGQIKEYGTHDELIEKNGSYAKMFELQARNYREGSEVA